jgi:hypothetical protein
VPPVLDDDHELASLQDQEPPPEIVIPELLDSDDEGDRQSTTSDEDVRSKDDAPSQESSTLPEGIVFAGDGHNSSQDKPTEPAVDHVLLDDVLRKTLEREVTRGVIDLDKYSDGED